MLPNNNDNNNNTPNSIVVFYPKQQQQEGLYEKLTNDVTDRRKRLAM